MFVVPTEAREVLDPLELLLHMVVSYHVGWELNLGPLEDQSVFLISEPLIQPLLVFQDRILF